MIHDTTWGKIWVTPEDDGTRYIVWRGTPEGTVERGGTLDHSTYFALLELCDNEAKRRADEEEGVLAEMEALLQKEPKALTREEMADFLASCAVSEAQ